MSLQQTTEQRRAARAWSNISAIKGQDYEGRYGAVAKKFPALVLTNGLGQALAFLRAKNKPQHRAFYKHVSSWVTAQTYGIEGDDKLLERLIGAAPGYESSSDIYRRATTETLAFINWLKRFAEAELEIEEGED
ncbi:MAG TPA: type III-B CRISPR module-associated protein Cmr5 [Candidatus Obscuribacterales bacterium]